jgi:hypothetical protein
MDITPLETKFLANITCVGTKARNGYESSAYMQIFHTHTKDGKDKVFIPENTAYQIKKPWNSNVLCKQFSNMFH